MKLKIDENLKEFYLATKNKKEFLIYQSDNFKFSELDILLLLKICMIEKRSKKIGRKILNIYKDATQDRLDLTLERLEAIGIKENKENDEPIKLKE